MSISRETLQRLEVVLKKYLKDGDECKSYLIRALGTGNPVKDRVHLQTAPSKFIPILIEELIHHGTVETGTPAICCLLETLSADVGEDVKLQIADLQEIVNQEIHASSKYLISDQSEPDKISKEDIAEIPYSNYNQDYDPVDFQKEKPSKKLTFSTLENYLKEKRWKDAELETRKIIFDFWNKSENQGIGVDEIREFPNELILKIDSLWVEYSDSHFGLSIQQKIWNELKLYPELYPEKECWYNFAQKVGWYKDNKWIPYNDLNFGLNSEVGCLPYWRKLWPKMRYQYEPKRFSELMSKIGEAVPENFAESAVVQTPIQSKAESKTKNRYLLLVSVASIAATFSVFTLIKFMPIVQDNQERPILVQFQNSPKKLSEADFTYHWEDKHPISRQKRQGFLISEEKLNSLGITTKKIDEEIRDLGGNWLNNAPDNWEGKAVTCFVNIKRLDGSNRNFIPCQF